ncbi:glycerol dehydratase reactivase beta/small subunit family protein [Kineosporia sp. J2-2]|uniref:Glycerol dehydratase reactivase beta/small subunit family protein n=1 Tax=Kineosporia corallincola TaxID=2835133 RepID=A0ABS5TTC8_9ACTN|nr:glycerol dehydratase reactivase beta/small subunit family protein [Kineosporia corallincola]MBT0774076.1 glycerol dehydratase reactivase beta/small subunit family protein [Kineosporia corallincola]
MLIRPHILVLTAGRGEPLRQLCAGIEEEGVPFEVRRGTPGTAASLAVEAARRSPLGVGVGLDATGLIVVHHSKLPDTQPVTRTREARRAGRHAARIVTGTPLDLEENR